MEQREPQGEVVGEPKGPALGRLALATFEKELPRLLEERPDQWVAYHGDRLIGFARTDLELIKECRRRGIPRTEYVVCCIEPGLPDIVDSPYPFD